MRTKALFSGMTAVILMAPFITSAASASDLQAQIASLMAQVHALQAQLLVLTGSNTVPSDTNNQSNNNDNKSNDGTAVSGTMGGFAISCPAVTHSLSVGAQGADVTGLQQFLVNNGYLNASATGYFGAMTREALGRWQVENGIARSNGNGYGMFGPMSRSFYARFCDNNGNGGSTNQQAFSADPQWGSAPLTVTFTTSDSITNAAVYTIDFGDGTTGSMNKGSCIGISAINGGQGGIKCSYTSSHTYTADGGYTAKLMKNTCPAGAECFVGPLTVATIKVSVDSSNQNQKDLSFTATPNAGVSPLMVQFTETAPQGTTLGTIVDFGDGTTGTMAFAPVCASCNAMATVSHTYGHDGTFKATLSNSMGSLSSGNCQCPTNMPCTCPGNHVLASAMITVSASTTVSNGSDQRVNAPGTVMMQQGGIAEVRNEGYYFTLTSLTSSSATIQVTPVGCWNSFPSDPVPQFRCMIAIIPIAPITLTVGQTALGNRPITLTQINGANATFSIGGNLSE